MKCFQNSDPSLNVNHVPSRVTGTELVIDGPSTMSTGWKNERRFFHFFIVMSFYLCCHLVQLPTWCSRPLWGEHPRRQRACSLKKKLFLPLDTFNLKKDHSLLFWAEFCLPMLGDNLFCFTLCWDQASPVSSGLSLKIRRGLLLLPNVFPFGDLGKGCPVCWESESQTRGDDWRQGCVPSAWRR